MLLLEPRSEPSTLMQAITPFMAVIMTIFAGGVLFAILGKDPFIAVRIIFWDPLFNETVKDYTRPQLFIKAAPLITIALGLAYGFRAGIWNIGAEGQFIMGALVGGAVGLAFYPLEAIWLLPLMVLAGTIGGTLWALIPALLKIYFRTNEILVSLMLVYVASYLLSGMVTGPLRSPIGYNFPVSRNFQDHVSTHNSEVIAGTGMHIGVFVMIAFVIVSYVIMRKHIFGFNVSLAGQSPRAARFAGIKPGLLIAICLGLSGGMAGMAGIFEATGPAGKLMTSFPLGYGFTAIIVAFLGRLHPVGIFLAGLLMALTYIGGELAQFMLGIPAAAINVFQGMLLFFLLAVDLLVNFRIKFQTPGRLLGFHSQNPRKQDS